MPQSNTVDPPLLSVAEILDKTTLVLVGAGLDQLKVGEELTVLAVGHQVRGTPNLLVLPKASVLVVANAGPYVIGRPRELEEVIEGAYALALGNAFGRRTVYVREQLTVDEDELRGNPASVPIRVGDPVVRPTDIAWYVKTKAAVVSIQVK